MSGLGYVLAALLGSLITWLVCRAVLRHPRSNGAESSRQDESIALEVFARSTTAYAVLNERGHLLLHNGRAVELGVVRAGILHARIRSAAERAVISDEAIDVQLGPVEMPVALAAVPRPAPTAVHAVAHTIGDGLVLVAASDESAARRVEDVRRDFVANVSHELKTPVSAIALLAEATGDAAHDPEATKRFAGRLQREATRLGALVNELITLSRLQGADPLPDLAIVEVDAVIDETIARVATAAEHAGIALTSDDPTGLLVKGDRAMLVTALTNLADNAVHYSPAGTPVSISRRLRAGYVEIAVTDRGIGIAAEHSERVFERFFRVDPARSRATGGTGLGLAIVKHVAANHGGSAGLWSRLGTGSTFTLRLPALQGAADPREEAPVNPEASVGAEAAPRAEAAPLAQAAQRAQAAPRTQAPLTQASLRAGSSADEPGLQHADAEPRGAL